MSDPQYKIKEWLAKKLEPHGAIALACAATGMSKDQLGRSKELASDDPKKRRSLKAHEIEKLSRHFNELPPGYEQMTNWLGVKPQSLLDFLMKESADLDESEKKRLAAFLLDLPLSDVSLPRPGEASPQGHEK